MSLEAADTRTRVRTRQTILDAAVAVLCRRPSASLAEVAEAAQVGRTTVHRYFPERSDLIDALSLHIRDQLRAALGRSRLHEGTGRAALVRASRELFDLGDLLVATTAGDPAFWERPEWQEEHETDALLRDAVRRGHEDGSIERSLSMTFVADSLLWSILYCGVSWLHDDATRSRHEALAMVVYSLEGALRPAQPGTVGPSGD